MIKGFNKLINEVNFIKEQRAKWFWFFEMERESLSILGRVQ